MRCLTLLSTLLTALAVVPASASAQTSTTYQWGNVAIGGGGFVSAVIPSKTEKGLFYARTDVGGAYRWSATSSRWVPLLDWVSESESGDLGVDALALDPKNSANVYMLAGISYYNGGKTVILRSGDYGQTFSSIDVSSQFKTDGNGMGRQNGERLQVDPGSSNVLYAGSRTSGLFRSTDSGSTWSRLASLPVTTTPNANGISFVWLDPTSVSNGLAQRIVVGVSRFGSVGPNLYVSTNAGATFTAVPNAPSAYMPQRAAYASDGHLYITFANGAGPHGHWSQPEPMNAGQIWKYRLADGAWINVTPAGFTTPFGGISVDPSNAQRLVASTINTYMQQGTSWGDHFFISTNGGNSWTDVVSRGFAMDTGSVTWAAGNAIHWSGSIEFDPFNPSAVWVTSGHGVFRTANIDAIPATWTFTVAGLEETVPLNFVSIPGGPLVSAIGDYDGFRHTDVTQYAPIHTPRMGTTAGLAYAALNPSVWVRTGGGNPPAMYYTTDSGATWNKTAIMNGSFGQVALSANGQVLLHNPADSTTTYRSTNYGVSWSVVGGLSMANIRPVADTVNSNKFYAYQNGAMMVSTDGGATFSAKTTLPAGGSNVIRATPGMEGHVWVPLYGSGLARSTDSGATFSMISNVSYAAAVGFGKAASGASYPAVYIWGTVGGVRGIHRSTDAGASWVRVNDDAHEYGGPGNGQAVIGDMNTYGVVYMSTSGRGIVYGKPQESTPAPTPAATELLMVRHSSKCADVNGVSQSPGASIIQYTCSSSAANQRWTEEDAGGGYVRLRVSHSGMCMDLAQQSTADGVALVQATCGTGTSQKWAKESMGGGWFRLKSAYSGKCVDVNGASTSNLAALIQYTCHTGYNQQWMSQ
jgi:hypothetical protein